MAEPLPIEIVRRLRDRSALLWVCQPFDLRPEAQPHDYTLPAAMASLLYREESSSIDAFLASCYWEGIFLEGAKSPLLNLLRQKQSQRQLVVLVGSSDASAVVSSQEFLPLAVLPGLIDAQINPDGRYGELKARARERIAGDLAHRLEQYGGRALIVIGATKERDLVRLYNALESARLFNLCLLVVWPPGEELPAKPDAAIDINIWRGSDAEFAEALSKAGVPSATDLPKWSVRVGGKSLGLAARDVDRILKRFILLTDQDLIPAQQLSKEDLQDFLDVKPDNWTAYGCGLPAPRSYHSEAGLTLDAELDQAFRFVEQSEAPTLVIQLPCEAGAGATTLIRGAAYRAAASGHPTLILRPDQVDVGLEDVIAFTTVLSDIGLRSGLDELPPLLLVADVDHEAIQAIRHLTQALAAAGRKAVLLQAVRDDPNDAKGRRGRRFWRLPVLQAAATPEEVGACQVAFARLTQRHQLPVVVPTLEEWTRYEQTMRYSTQQGHMPASSLFWVALRFFLIEGMDLSLRRSAEDALGEWIIRRTSSITDLRAREIIRYVAALSTFRIIAPLWTVLRPVFGSVFSSDLGDALNQMDNIVIWGQQTEELADPTITFSHPALAAEFLRREGFTTPEERIRVLEPVLTSLSAGPEADAWIVESLAALVLSPRYDERSTMDASDWGWRLDAFERIPVAIRDQSKTILHHWARCLYLSADARVLPPIPLEERIRRVRCAIDKLKIATSITRRHGRDEHPSHLFNTLGVAHFRYAHLLQDAGAKTAAITEEWNAACVAFQKSIDLLPGANIEALFAFTHRLIDHARGPEGAPKLSHTESSKDAAYALSLLDEAEEAVSQHPTPNPDWESDIASYRGQALGLLDETGGLDFARELQRTGDASLGYYCEARLVLRDPEDQNDITKAIGVLKTAEKEGVELDARGIAFRLYLARKHDLEQFNFPLLLQMHQKLESLRGRAYAPVDMFRHAVLCYQIGQFQEGVERFRRLREYSRSTGAATPRVRDVWRDPTDLTKPRLAVLRVTRINSPWDGDAYVDAIRQSVPIRPQHFVPAARLNEVKECVIRFEFTGPKGVPPRFEQGNPRYSPAQRNRR